MGSAQKLKTARSLKDAEEPEEVWVLSEFLKAPSENMGGRQHVFRDPTNPLVKVSINFTRKWERPKDMWAPDLERVYVDTNQRLVLRPDDSNRRNCSGKEYDSSWKYIQVPVTWQHLMVEHLLFTSAVSSWMFRGDGLASAPVQYASDSEGPSQIISSIHTKSFGVTAGYPICWPRNALILILNHPVGLRVWAGDMCKHLVQKVGLSVAINMVVQYIENDIDKRPHHEFDTSYRVVDVAQGSLRKIHREMAVDRQARKNTIDDHIETLR
jgi:hypothetical protein